MIGRIFAVVNPAAGGGRGGQNAQRILERIRAAGLAIEVAQTRAPGEASALAREAFERGFRRFLSMGGDGTAFEVINGLFPYQESQGRPELALLPLGTGNSFLKDFGYCGPEQTIEDLLDGRTQRCDVIRLTHSQGEFYFINLLTLGFAADVADVVNRRFKWLGQAGYVLGVLVCVARLEPQFFPLRTDDSRDLDRKPCLFLAFSNTRYTGGKMLIAPDADPRDGLIEYVRWGPIGRFGLLRNLPRLFDGTHIRRPQASRRAVRRVEFEMDAPVNVTLDGESMRLQCRSIEVLPAALDIVA
jgi:YegS/Rv2252/BmrU family lipid kinase